MILSIAADMGQNTETRGDSLLKYYTYFTNYSSKLTRRPILSVFLTHMDQNRISFQF